MNVTTEVKVAPWGSIQKWDKIVTAFRIAERDDSDPKYTERGPGDCPLCKLFNKGGQGGGTCEGCPILKDTGEAYCEKTPYAAWYDEGDDYSSEGGIGRTQENAEAMLDYLVDLNNRCEVES